MHEALTITIPVVVAVLIAALVNGHHVEDLLIEMNRRFDVVDSELRYFHGETGSLRGRVEELSKRVE